MVAMGVGDQNRLKLKPLLRYPLFNEVGLHARIDHDTIVTLLKVCDIGVFRKRLGFNTLDLKR